MAPSLFIRQARQAAQMTQAELAERLGTSQPVIARLERQGTNPTWATVLGALHATGYNVQLVPLDGTGIELDLGQLRERLAMSPADRLRTFQSSQESLARLRGRARRRDR